MDFVIFEKCRSIPISPKVCVPFSTDVTKKSCLFFAWNGLRDVWKIENQMQKPLYRWDNYTTHVANQALPTKGNELPNISLYC